MTNEPVHVQKFRVAEIFGPTIQGEGRHVGAPCYFVRFGGCDYRCSWCDSLHAVLPEHVSQLPQMSAEEIAEAIWKLPGRAMWIVFSGGNPALLNLDLLVALIQNAGRMVMVETQGSAWKPYLEKVDEICVSPKPPSAGYSTTVEEFTNFCDQFTDWPINMYLKIPIFTQADYDYAVAMHTAFPEHRMFLSVGNEAPPQPLRPDKNPIPGVLEKTRWLFEKVALDPRMRDVRAFPQQHVLAWGNERAR